MNFNKYHYYGHTPQNYGQQNAQNQQSGSYVNYTPIPPQQLSYTSTGYKSNLNMQSASDQKVIPSKVLVNPHFKKTVYINRNFQNENKSKGLYTPKIHVNPNNPKLTSAMQRVIDLSKTQCKSNEVNIPKIHINPNMKNKIDILKEISEHNTVPNIKNDIKPKEIHVNPNILPNIGHKPVSNLPLQGKKIISTKNKLIRLPVTKIIHTPTPMKKRNSLVTKYKLIKSSVICNNKNTKINKFRIDNRIPVNKQMLNTSVTQRRKYVYTNKLQSLSEIAKSRLFKTNKMRTGYVEIGGVRYRKTVNSLSRSVTPSIKGKKLIHKLVKINPSKLVTSDVRKVTFKQSNTRKSLTFVRKSVSSKLKKCNIPCPNYRKFGRCLRKDKGKCYHKHDPNQIALCTRFLQGACINDKCLLSHKVSGEKMPTCKYYLEGSCSRDNCPYLHVKINPKAEICRDFLEGYCQKAGLCDKRHQLLCPDYEKNGSCPKRRCQYPHGNLVRKYTVPENVAKKCSNETGRLVHKLHIQKELPSNVNGNTVEIPRCFKNENIVEKAPRYYLGNEKLNTSLCVLNKLNDQEIDIRSRPKLGDLPSYIPLSEENI